MKKQLLLVTLALFAGILSYAQVAVNNPASAPRGVSCEDDALHPIAGNSYDYQASGTPTGGTFQFWATTDQNFITTTGTPATTVTNVDSRLTVADGELLAASPNYGNATTTDLVSITWSDAVLNAALNTPTPTFVAVHYVADATNCADNFKVWEIEPIVAFTVDIKNIENESGAFLGYTDTESQCFDIVRGATYNGGTVNYDFGTQVLYFEVVAANFTGSFTPSFEITSTLGTGQSAVIDFTTTPPPYTTAPTWYPEGTVVTTEATETSIGVSIYVRVTITNTTYEGTTDTDITLAVDAQNSVGQWDIDNGNGDLCLATTAADLKDTATQTLTARPTVGDVTPNPFVPGNQTK